MTNDASEGELLNPYGLTTEEIRTIHMCKIQMVVNDEGDECHEVPFHIVENLVNCIDKIIAKANEMSGLSLGELEKYKALYNPLNELLCKIGVEEEVHPQSPEYMKCMDALYPIDSGTFNPLPAPTDEGEPND